MVELIHFLFEKLFVYLLITLITCSLVEMVLVSYQVRGKVLSKWLQTVFDQQVPLPDGTRITLGRAIMGHSLLTGLSRPGSIPSYVEAKNFALALVEKITYNPNDALNYERNIDNIIITLKQTNILSVELVRTFLDFAYEAKEKAKGVDEVRYFRVLIETWFNNSMNSLTGTFKVKYARPITLFFATIVVVALNVDSIVIVQSLYSNSANKVNTTEAGFDTSLFRKIDLIRTSSAADSVALSEIKQSIKTTTRTLDSIQLEVVPRAPIGWGNTGKLTFPYIINKIIGLYATILIIILLAPTLFELGNKYSNIRGAGPKTVVLEAAD